MELESIFIESNEALGLLYNRYYKIPMKINTFLNSVEEAINAARKSEVPDMSKLDLSKKLTEFKSSVSISMTSPEHIDPKDIRSLRTNITNTKKTTESILSRLGKLRSKFAFGKNWISGILVKPKVFEIDNVDPKFHDNVNKFMREIGRSLDWAEKTTLELLNLADQDLNLLSLIQKVYFRKIFESADIMNDDIDAQFETYFTVGTDEGDDEEEYDDMVHGQIKDDDYYPIYSVIVSYDLRKLDIQMKMTNKNLPDDVKKLLMRGKGIRNVTHGDNYTHTLVSLDTSFRNLYHFLGKGFGVDDIMENKAFELTKSIYVNVTFLTKGELNDVKKQLNHFEVEQDKTAYDLVQFATQMLGKANHKNNRLLCSTFLGYLLATANPKNLHRDFSKIRPEDITILPRSFYVIEFKDREDFVKRKDEFEKRVRQIYADNIDEIKEYNNELPKVLLKSHMKEKGSLDKFMDWIVKKLS